MATVTFEKAQRWYPGTDAPAVPGIDLEINDGEFNQSYVIPSQNTGVFDSGDVKPVEKGATDPQYAAAESTRAIAAEREGVTGFFPTVAGRPASGHLSLTDQAAAEAEAARAERIAGQSDAARESSERQDAVDYTHDAVRRASRGRRSGRFRDRDA